MAFKRLTLEERVRIENFLERGMVPDKIAEKINVAESTIYRENKRSYYDK